MHPNPVRPARDVARDPAAHQAPGGLGRAPAAAAALLAAAALMLAVVTPGAAAVIDSSWKASVGSGGANGSATVAALSSGVGSATIRLSGLPKSAAVALTIRAGTCAKPGAAAATLPASRSTSAGKLSKTAALSRTAVAKIKAARSLILQVRSGSFARCAVLRKVTGGSASPSPTAGVEVEIKAKGFAFSPGTISIAAGSPVTISFRNDDSGVPHGVDIAKTASDTPLAASAVITGVARTTFTIPALPDGTYAIWCPVHPRMTATLQVGGAGAASASPTAAATASPAPQQTAEPTAPPTPEPTRYEPPPTYYPY